MHTEIIQLITHDVKIKSSLVGWARMIDIQETDTREKHFVRGLCFHVSLFLLTIATKLALTLALYF